MAYGWIWGISGVISAIAFALAIYRYQMSHGRPQERQAAIQGIYHVLIGIALLGAFDAIITFVATQAHSL